MTEVLILVGAALGVGFLVLVVHGFVKAERAVKNYWQALVGEYGVDFSFDRLVRESRGAASGLASIKAGHLEAMVRPLPAGILVWRMSEQAAVIPWNRMRLINVRDDGKSEITIEVTSKGNFEKVVTLPWKPSFNSAMHRNLPQSDAAKTGPR
jgi:hypothetical protein